MDSKSDQSCLECGYRLELEIQPDGEKKYTCPYCRKNKSELGLHRDLQIDDFILSEKLGSGGMGEVWKAKQLSMNRDVALKILSPKLSEDTAFVKRFLNEAIMTGKLRHPNIITAYTAGNVKNYYYLAMLYVDGIELLDKIKIDGVIPEREALNIIRVVASALCYAWEEHNILHCDIKPGNIMIDRYRTPYLMDMGISKIVSENESSPNLPKHRMIVGSLQYMSPEQSAGDTELDLRTDIYSLGATLYQMVTASLPFGCKTVETAIIFKTEKHLPPPNERNPYLSPGCSELITQMMANNREDRQSDWNYVIADIDAVLSGTYTSKRKMKVKRWDLIEAKPKNFNINAPISLGRGIKTKVQEDSKVESSKATQKIVKETVEAVSAPEPQTHKMPPPVVFDAGKERHSGLKLLILLIIFILTAVGTGVYYLLKWLR